MLNRPTTYRRTVGPVSRILRFASVCVLIVGVAGVYEIGQTCFGQANRGRQETTRDLGEGSGRLRGGDRSFREFPADQVLAPDQLRAHLLRIQSERARDRVSRMVPSQLQEALRKEIIADLPEETIREIAEAYREVRRERSLSDDQSSRATLEAVRERLQKESPETWKQLEAAGRKQQENLKELWKFLPAESTHGSFPRDDNSRAIGDETVLEAAESLLEGATKSPRGNRQNGNSRRGSDLSDLARQLRRGGTGGSQSPFGPSSSMPFQDQGGSGSSTRAQALPGADDWSLVDRDRNSEIGAGQNGQANQNGAGPPNGANPTTKKQPKKMSIAARINKKAQEVSLRAAAAGGTRSKNKSLARLQPFLNGMTKSLQESINDSFTQSPKDRRSSNRIRRSKLPSLFQPRPASSDGPGSPSSAPPGLLASFLPLLIVMLLGAGYFAFRNRTTLLATADQYLTQFSKPAGTRAEFAFTNELVAGLDELVVRQFEPAAKTWNHSQVQTALVDFVPQSTSEIDQLIETYKSVRYAERNSVDARQLERASTILASLSASLTLTVQPEQTK